MSDKNYAWYVYMHINKINNKKYVGITCKQTPQKRWGKNGHHYLLKYKNGTYKHPLFANAINKYGWDNFEHIVLYSELSEQEAKQKEIELIAYYHTYVGDPECNGYNMTLGGDGKVKYSTKFESQIAFDLWYKQYTSTEEFKLKRQKVNAAAKQKRKIDELKHEKDLSSARNTKHRVALLRQQLFTMYTKFPELFSEAQLQICFSKKLTTTNHWNYCCYSITKLQDIYINIMEQLDEEERSNFDFNKII